MQYREPHEAALAGRLALCRDVHTPEHQEGMLRSEKSVARIRELLRTADVKSFAALADSLHADSRAGVQSLLASTSRRLEREQAELDRLLVLYATEAAYHQQGVTLVAGVDEVGRGALAGPVTAGAVILPADPHIPGLDDSKRLSPKRRTELASAIKEHATAWAVGHVDPPEVDALGISRATKRAMCLAIDSLTVTPMHVIIDGNPAGLGYQETAVVKGDSRVAAIAAASILAKVERDALMTRYADIHPGWDFDINKGYGTEEHMSRIRTEGPCPIHRRSFSPCGDSDTLF